MNTQEKMLYLSSKLMMLSVDRKHNEKEILVVSEELAALQRQMKKASTYADALKIEDDDGFLKFTKQEILKMPKTFRKEFRIQGRTAHVRKRPSGKHTYCYEIRYHRNSYNISVTAKTIELAKEKFIQRLIEIDTLGDSPKIIIPNTFDKFALYYYENFRKRKVVPDVQNNP